MEPAPPPAAPVPAWGAVAPPPPPPPAAWSTPDAAPLRPAPVDSDDDFVVPEGLVDVERRSNCSLDAIVAVLSQCPTFRRTLGNGADAEAAQSDALRYLGDAFRASAGGSDAEVDAAVDGLRAALAARGDQDEDGEGVRSELATGGAHLDVAEVLGEVVSVLGTAKKCRGGIGAAHRDQHIHGLVAVIGLRSFVGDGLSQFRKLTPDGLSIVVSFYGLIALAKEIKQSHEMQCSPAGGLIGRSKNAR